MIVSVSDARRAVIFGEASGLCRCGLRAPVVTGPGPVSMTCPSGHRTEVTSPAVQLAAARFVAGLPAGPGELSVTDLDLLALHRRVLAAAVDDLYATHDIRRA